MDYESDERDIGVNERRSEGNDRSINYFRSCTVIYRSCF
jgi:hypothetical protein